MTAIDTNTDILYTALCSTCDVLEEINCSYFLAGGTLLGAKRAGDLIPHDIDFDLDCLSKDEEKILNAQDLFAQKGLSIRRQMSLAPQRLNSSEQTKTPLYCSCIHVEYQGIRIGDIYIFTIFNDGIARRFDIESGTYANAKMSLPAWYYDGNEFLSIRNRKFRSVKAPELVLEKIYGTDWETPLKPGQFAKNRNATSGSVPDADIEKLILYALENGWSGQHTKERKWPQPIQWVGWPADVSREWIFRHEPLIHEEISSWIKNVHLSQSFSQISPTQIQVIARIFSAKGVQSEYSRQKQFPSKGTSELSWSKRLFIWLPLPKLWKIHLKNTLNSFSRRH